MESQPQNPKFRNNPEHFHPCLLTITSANSLDPDQAQQNVGPDLDPNCLTLMVFQKEFFETNSK